ncbi:MAG: Sporulation kinase E [Deltaproteobacteria bacterium ADurb.Bin135]|nr:MAG: Sporulation kinase E [Deltaproteobacteria bacterium ADurb.Bin135]
MVDHKNMDDIVELKLALTMLRERELRYRALFDNANDAIFLMEKGVIIDCNHKFLTMFGCSRRQIIGQTIYRFSPQFQPDGRDSKEKAIAKGKAALSGKPQFFAWKHCQYDGTPFDAEVSLNRIELNRDKIVLQAMIRDVSEQKEAENRLRLSEEKYRSIFENAIGGIFQTTPEGKVITANTTFASMYGYDSPQEMINSVTDIGKEIYVNPKDRERFKAICEEQGFVEGFEEEVYRKDRKKAWVSINARAVRDVNGKTLYYEGTIEDISLRKEIEDALRTSEERYRIFIDSTSDGVFLKDEQLRYTIVNKQLRTFFKKDEGEIIGKTDFDLRSKKDAEKAHQADKKSLRASSIVITEDTVNDRVYEIRRFAVKLGKNNMGIGGFVRDVTKRKRAEEDLKTKTLNLEEVNAALKVLLRQRDKDKSEMEDKILNNVKKLVLPYIERLKGKQVDEETKVYLGVIETNLQNILSPFVQKLSSRYSQFTPTEIRVANLIREGKTIKEIAVISGISENAVNHHRQSIRNKLGLNRQKINLRTHLMSLS